MTRLTAALLLLSGVTACDKPSADTTPAPASTSATTPVASSSARATASASSAPVSPAATQSWRGTYKSAASTLWSDTQTTAGIGDGALALSIDGASGHVSGTVDGPLGPATVDGVVTEGTLAATLRRKDPSDQGFTGTLLGSVASDHVEGTMNVSLGLASALRTATFTLTPGAAP